MRGGRPARLDRSARPLLEPVDEPADDERTASAGHQVAERVDAAGLVRGADLEHEVAVAQAGLQPVVREERHLDELARPEPAEAEPVVEQRRAEAERDGQVRRTDRRAEDAALRRRVQLVAGLGRPAGGDPGDAAGQFGQRRDELRATLDHRVEGDEERRGLRSDRGHDASLVDAVERDVARHLDGRRLVLGRGRDRHAPESTHDRGRADRRAPAQERAAGQVRGRRHRGREPPRRRDPAFRAAARAARTGRRAGPA